MSNLKKSLLLVIILVSLFSSCIEDEPVNQGNVSQGKLELSFSLPSISNQRIKRDSAAFILLSIVDVDGVQVLEKQKIELYFFSGNIISEPISLNTGSYQLTEYLVLNNNNEVIYATPNEKAKLNYLVKNPLPIDFTIEKDQTQKITPEVISTSSIDPADFGYSTFSFHIVNTLDFLVSVFAYDTASDNFQLTDAQLTIKNSSNILFNHSIGDSTNSIKIQDGYATYQIFVEKEGYATYQQALTVNELKSYQSNPLIIKLFSNVKLDSGLVAFYPFNGNAVDESSNSYDGTIQGAVLTHDRLGSTGKAYKLDGVDDKITFGNVLDFGSSDFTISFWINVNVFIGQIPGTGTYGGWVINKGITVYGTPSRAGYGINARKYNEKNYVQFYMGNQQDQTFLVEKEGFSEETWYQITVVRQSLKQKLYVNGVLVSESSLPNTFSVNTNIPLVFGSIDKFGNDPTGTSYFNGAIDDVRFYNRALSLEEITYLYEY